MLTRAMNFSELVLHDFSFSFSYLKAFIISFMSHSEFNCRNKMTIVSKSEVGESESILGSLFVRRGTILGVFKKFCLSLQYACAYDFVLVCVIGSMWGCLGTAIVTGSDTSLFKLVITALLDFMDFLFR